MTFFCHAQTLSLIGLLRLGWPKSAEAVTDTLGLHPGCTRCRIELGARATPGHAQAMRAARLAALDAW